MSEPARELVSKNFSQKKFLSFRLSSRRAGEPESRKAGEPESRSSEPELEPEPSSPPSPRSRSLIIRSGARGRSRSLSAPDARAGALEPSEPSEPERSSEAGAELWSRSSEPSSPRSRSSEPEPEPSRPEPSRPEKPESGSPRAGASRLPRRLPRGSELRPLRPPRPVRARSTNPLKNQEIFQFF